MPPLPGGGGDRNKRRSSLKTSLSEKPGCPEKGEAFLRTVGLFRESFCESEEGVRLPREMADLQGSPGNFRGSPGNFRGTSGLLFSSRELPGKSPKTSGEVRGTSWEVRGLSRSSGEPDSLRATRQICLQTFFAYSRASLLAVHSSA